MTETFSVQLDGTVTDTAVAAQDGVVSFYQLIKESVFDSETAERRDAYSCLIITVFGGETDTALLRDVSSRKDTASALFSSLVRGSVTPVTVYDVIEDMIV